MTTQRAAVAAALALSFILSLAKAPEAVAQVEVEMTPTPTPTPEIAPMPSFPEGGTPRTDGSTETEAAKVRIDRGGMFGGGFMIGNTATGATAKYWMSDRAAMQFSTGAGPVGNNLRFQLDVLYVHSRWEAEDGIYALPFYVGLGAQAGIFFKNPHPEDRTDLGLRIPLGMSVVIPDNPVEVYFEVAPSGAIYDDSKENSYFVFYVDGRIGLRYYF